MLANLSVGYFWLSIFVFCRTINHSHATRPALRLDCPKNYLKCNGTMCVHESGRCDGTQHCDDGSDEKGCKFINNSCEIPSQFRCRSHKLCVDEHLTCDGINDCDDGSDEQNCVPCDFPFIIIIMNSKKIKQFRDKDHCLQDYFRCADGSRFIKNSLRCNGQINCKDRSDEKICDTNDPSNIRKLLAHEPWSNQNYMYSDYAS